MRQKLLRYLFSRRNLWAAGASSLVALLGVVGLLDSWWWLISGAAYAAVWLLPLGKEAEVQAKPVDLSTEQSIEWLREHALEKLPASAREVLADLLARAAELMPRLKEMEGVGLVQAENRAALKQTVKTYLPQAIEVYLKLPPLYARTARVADGHTAEEVLLAQLRTLRDHVSVIQDGVLSKEVDVLLSQSRYLNERFARPVSLFDTK